MSGRPQLPSEPPEPVAARAVLAGVGRPPPNLAPGTLIGGKYRIERELGQGGFGVVVRAIHLALDQRVAIKVLTEAEGTTEAEWAEDAERFRREATATASLRSEHVVRVLDVDVLEGGYPYIVMEYLDGRTMHELTYTSRAPLKTEDVADYGIQMLAALADAHAAGFVHRDLKPANVFLANGIGGTPTVKVLDFGVSKVLAAASLRLTRTGAMVGTLAYMAPEQMRDAHRVDGRADLWSVGVVLYEALARQHPFGAHTAGPKAVTAILNDPVPPLATYRPDVPAGLEVVIQRLLEKAAERRFSTAGEAALALAPFATARSRPVLDAILRTPPPQGPAAADFSPEREPSGSPSQARRSNGRSPLARFVLVFVTAALVLGIVAVAALYARHRFLP
jgi:serine/threonine-protein kinase